MRSIESFSFNLIKEGFQKIDWHKSIVVNLLFSFLFVILVTSCSSQQTINQTGENSSSITYSTPSLSINSTPSLSPTPLPTSIPKPVDILLINLYQYEKGVRINDGVIRYDLEKGVLTEYLPIGNIVYAVSSDGKFLIVLEGKELSLRNFQKDVIYIIDKNFIIKYPFFDRRVVWLPEGNGFVYIDSKNKYHVIDTNGVEIKSIQKPENYFSNQADNFIGSKKRISPNGLMTATSKGGITTIQQKDAKNSIIICGPKSVDPQLVKLFEDGWTTCFPEFWSPDSSKLAVTILSKDHYKTAIFANDGKLISISDCIGNPSSWSPNSELIAYAFGRYGVEVCDALTGKAANDNRYFNGHVVQTDNQSVQNIFWIQTLT